MPVDVSDALLPITFAAAKTLDYLLHAALPVIIPDAYKHDALSAGGRERTETDYGAQLTKTGQRLTRVIRVPGASAIIEAVSA
jgi:hypothetical protein